MSAPQSPFAVGPDDVKLLAALRRAPLPPEKADPRAAMRCMHRGYVEFARGMVSVTQAGLAALDMHEERHRASLALARATRGKRLAAQVARRLEAKRRQAAPRFTVKKPDKDFLPPLRPIGWYDARISRRIYKHHGAGTIVLSRQALAHWTGRHGGGQ